VAAIASTGGSTTGSEDQSATGAELADGGYRTSYSQRPATSSPGLACRPTAPSRVRTCPHAVSPKPVGKSPGPTPRTRSSAWTTGPPTPRAPLSPRWRCPLTPPGERILRRRGVQGRGPARHPQPALPHPDHHAQDGAPGQCPRYRAGRGGVHRPITGGCAGTR